MQPWWVGATSWYGNIVGNMSPHMSAKRFQRNRITDLFRPSFVDIDIWHFNTRLQCIILCGAVVVLIWCGIHRNDVNVQYSHSLCYLSAMLPTKMLVWTLFPHVLLLCIIATNDYVGVNTFIHKYNMCEQTIRNVLCVCANCHCHRYLSPSCRQPNMSVWPMLTRDITCVHIYTHWWCMYCMMAHRCVNVHMIIHETHIICHIGQSLGIVGC